MAQTARLVIEVDARGAKSNADDLANSLSGVEKQGEKTAKKIKETSDSIKIAGTNAKDASDKVGIFKAQLSQAANDGKFGSNIQLASSKLSEFKNIASGSSLLLSGLFATGVIAGASALSQLTIEFAKTNAELATFASISNTSIESFQGLAVGAGVLGISQEKLADQLKDFNEKIGEFASVGSGGAKDFFEQIAVKTEHGAEGAKKLAEEMSKMDGTTALQTYVNKLEEAGVNQQQMSFYLESMGSDLTQLMPLLIDNGKAWKDLADAASDAGVIIGDDAVEASLRMTAQTEALDMQLQGMKNQLLSSVMPAVSNLIGLFVDGTDKATGLDQGISVVKVGMNAFSGIIVTTSGVVRTLFTYVKEMMVQLINSGTTLYKVVTAGSFSGAFDALKEGVAVSKESFKNLGDVAIDSAKKSINAFAGESASLNNLGKALYNVKKTQQELNKERGKGLTTGIAQNKTLTPPAPKAKQSNINKAKQLQDKIEKERQSIIMQYADDELKLELKYGESKKKISEAFANDPVNENLYLAKAKQAYELDLAAYKQAQKEKYDSYHNDFLSKMADAEDAISLSSIANKFGKNSFEFQVAGLNISAKNAKSREYDDYTNSVNQINKDYNTPEMANQRYELLEQAKAAHIEKMKALDIDYHDSAKQLADDQQQSQLSLWSNLVSSAQNTFSQITQSVMSANDEQSNSYKIAFLAQQSFAFASAMISAQLASLQVASDASITLFGAKIAASKAMLAMGYAQAGLIAAQTISGFSEGGYTGAGGKYDVAGVVHKGEVVFSQSDVARLGGVNNVESMRTGRMDFTRDLSVGRGAAPKVIINNYGNDKVEASQDADGNLLVTIGKMLDQKIDSGVDRGIMRNLRQGYPLSNAIKGR